MSSRDRVMVDGAGTAIRAVVVTPDGSPPAQGWPGVVVLHEAFGVQPEILDVADRFAGAGWAAIVPDYFSAGSKLRCLVRAMAEVQRGRPGPITDLLVAATRALADRPDVDGGRLATIGFCMGGGFALLLGAAGPDGIRAVSCNYGEPPKEDVLRTSPPVVASYGGRDRMFGPKAKVLRERLDRCGVANDVKVYDDAGHSFLTEGEHVLQKVFVPLHGGYVPGAADDAWARIFEWLDRHVKGS